MKYLILITSIFFFSCGSFNKTKRFFPENKIVILDSISLAKHLQTYTIVIPKNWYSYTKSSNLVFHSPKKLTKKDVVFNNPILKIIQTSIDKSNSKTLKEFVRLDIIKRKKATQSFKNSLTIHKGKLGEFYLSKNTTTKNFKTYSGIVTYYFVQGIFYKLEYSSFYVDYEEYYQDALKIIDSFKIKEFPTK